MDNSHMEKQAESYVTSQLLKFKFKVTKPSFDKKGADLIVIENIDSKTSKFLLIQSKGRSVNNTNTNVSIPSSYITDYFIAFIYTQDDEMKENLFIFFPEDIKKWNINSKNEYILNFNLEKIQTDYFLAKTFDKIQAKKLETLLKQAEIKKYTSVIIDGIFLGKTINKTIIDYSKIYPGKTFYKPSISSVVANILQWYDRFKAEQKTINCYLFLNDMFALEGLIDIEQDKLKFSTDNGNQVRIFINKSREIIAFEALEQLDRIINNDNVILVADDQIYETPLNELKEKGVDIITVMLHEDDGGNMFTKFRWGDIIYPLALSLGIQKHEL